MSDYLPSFIVDPVLRQARRFSRLNGEESPGPASLPANGFLPNVPDFQRFNPSRFWNSTSPPPSAGDDESVESTWQSLARNIQLWANQINNLDVIPSPPLDPMGDAVVEDIDEEGRRGIVEFPELEEPMPQIPRPTLLQDHRAISDTSLNPAIELPFRSRVLAEAARGHSQSDPISHPGNEEPTAVELRTSQEPESRSSPRRTGSGILPEDDGMGALRQRINAIWSGPGTAAEKSRLVHTLMMERYRRSQNPVSTGLYSPAVRTMSPLSIDSRKTPQPVFHLTESDVAPTFAPLDSEDTLEAPATEPAKPDLGCIHYKRNVKMQCATCEKWYTCRLCHDEIEDHTLPRRETKFMLCMLCRSPQPVGQVCRSCGIQAANYYCSVCKLWNNDPRKSVYHCDDCGICRLGEGLGKDFFHCKTCAACMSIQAESTHRCIEKSTKCDCPICGEYMFTSNKPVAFMRCGHSIHESCFAAWCNTSYKCPICSKSIANMESQFRRLDRHIEEQPMPEEYRDNRAYVFCNDCNSRSITRYHWLGLKCTICESYNTTQLELLGPEQTPQEIQEQTERAQELGVGEAGLTASQSHTPTEDLTSPAADEARTHTRQPSVDSLRVRAIARSPPGRGSPFSLPHSPTRSARSITPVVGSYFGTGQQRPSENTRRGSYFSIFSAGQPRSPRSDIAHPASVRSDDGRGIDIPDPNVHTEDEEDLDFWGRQSPRSANHTDMVLPDAQSESSSSSEDEVMKEDTEDDEEEEDDAMDIFGHR